MARLTLLLAALAAAFAAALAAMRSIPEFSLFRAPGSLPFLGFPAPQGAFEAVGTGLYKLDLPWFITPFHRETLDLYAVELGGGAWALSDAGGHDTALQAHASGVAAALAALFAQRGGTLTHVLRARPAGPRSKTLRCCVHTHMPTG